MLLRATHIYLQHGCHSQCACHASKWHQPSAAAPAPLYPPPVLLSLFGLHLCQFLQTNWLLLTSFFFARSSCQLDQTPSHHSRPLRRGHLHREFCAQIDGSGGWHRSPTRSPFPLLWAQAQPATGLPLKALSNEISARCCTWLFAQLPTASRVLLVTPFPTSYAPLNLSSCCEQWRCQAQAEGNISAWIPIDSECEKSRERERGE